MNILELLIHCRLHAAPSAAPLWPADGSQRVHGNDGRPRPDGSVDGRTAVHDLVGPLGCGLWERIDG